MTTSEAIEITERFQRWRTGEDERSMREANIVPKKVTEAINILIATAKSLKDNKDLK